VSVSRPYDPDPAEPHGFGYDAPPYHDAPDGRIETSSLDDLPPEQRAAVERLDRIATLLDSQFSILGIRFGIEPILGILPVAGDLAGAAFSGYLVLEAARFGAPKRTLAKMAVNVGLDAVFGSVPVLGTIFDVAYKANKRNVRILRRHLTGGR